MESLKVLQKPYRDGTIIIVKRHQIRPPHYTFTACCSGAILLYVSFKKMPFLSCCSAYVPPRKTAQAKTLDIMSILKKM